MAKVPSPASPNAAAIAATQLAPVRQETASVNAAGGDANKELERLQTISEPSAAKKAFFRLGAILMIIISLVCLIMSIIGTVDMVINTDFSTELEPI